MPAYANVDYVRALMSGVPLVVWNAETPNVDQQVSASQQVALPPSRLAPNLSIDGKFSGAPGAFEVDVQVAEVDSDTNYQTIANGNITTVDTTNFTFHMDAVTSARFARLLMRSRTNPVSITATFTR
jgi:hypothetical protein